MVKFENHKYSKYLMSKTNEIIHYAVKLFKLNPKVENELDVNVVFNNTDTPEVKSNVKNSIKKFEKLIGHIATLDIDEGTKSELLEVLERVTKILKEENHNTSGSLYEFLRGLERFDGRIPNDLLHEILKLMVNINFGHKVSAVYDDKNHTITMYCLNIPDNQDEYLSLFAHELFHAIHFKTFTSSNFEKLNRYYHEVVLESLAAYFQYMYLKFIDLRTLSDELEQTFYHYPTIYYPYSGAKYLIDNNDVAINVFDLTRYKFMDGLYKLIDDVTERELILLVEKGKNIMKSTTNKNLQNLSSTASSLSENLPDFCKIFNNDVLGNPLVTIKKQIPLWIIPQDPQKFKDLYFEGHKVIYIVNYDDGSVQYMGPGSHKRNGKIDDLGVYLRTKNKITTEVAKGHVTSILVVLIS